MTTIKPTNLGTPKTLQEAIDQALCIGPLSEVRERTFFAVKDFLAQKFGVAMLKAGAMEDEALRQLFLKITGERVELPEPPDL